MAYDILIIDDQQDICKLISDVLAEEGYVTRYLTHGRRVLESIREKIPHLIIMDIWLNDSRFDGIELLDIIKQDYPFLPIVMISGHGTIETAVNALKKGAYDFIEKPFKTDRLLSIVAHGLQTSNLQKQLISLKAEGPPLFLCGQSVALSTIRQTIDRVAKTNSRVMIEGPSGSGKELVARLIHERSTRSQCLFVVFNCAAVDPQKLEEELFGVELHAGTSDVSIKLGVLEKADQGTLLLDCISDIPLSVQGKLVHILQDKRFCRVGGTRPIDVDVRIMSATLSHIHDFIQQGKFREDLYYRLNVVPIQIPALSQRIEDILDLAEYFLNLQNTGLSQKQYQLDQTARMALEAYPWPGNVRQLKNMMEWILIMHPLPSNFSITRDLLPPEVLQAEKEALSTMTDTRFYDMPLREAREEFERRYLGFHIRRFAGNITKTATAVEMERTALHRKIKSLHLMEGEEN